MQESEKKIGTIEKSSFAAVILISIALNSYLVYSCARCSILKQHGDYVTWEKKANLTFFQSFKRKRIFDDKYLSSIVLDFLACESFT